VVNTGITDAGKDQGRVAITQRFNECFISAVIINWCKSSHFCVKKQNESARKAANSAIRTHY
jgi:hypothetical protein